MPIPGNFSCSVASGEGFDSKTFRTIERDHEGKRYLVTVGKRKGSDSMEEVMYRYSPDDGWDEKTVKAHCKDHDGKYEPPAKDGEQKPEGQRSECLPCRVEQRCLSITDSELRAEPEARTITGYASVFYAEGVPGTQFQLGPKMYERIMPSAFQRMIDGGTDVIATFNHDRNLLLGRRSAGTLSVVVDSRGLKYVITPPDTQIARDVIANVRVGNLTGSSFSFLPEEQKWKEERGLVIREIHDAHVFDLGPVSIPAYANSSVSMRSQDLEKIEEEYRAWKEQQEIEQRAAEAKAALNVRLRGYAERTVLVRGK
jgi:uncharacterized protein